MSPNDDRLPTFDPRTFDLLADGELSEDQRRELLSVLDDVPDGWRSCALAFLEAQTWEQDLGSLVEKSGSAASGPPPRAARSRSSTFGRGGTLLAMAASFLVALGLGLLAGRAWNAGTPVGPSSPDLVAEEKPAEGPAGSGSELAAAEPPNGSVLPQPDAATPWQTVRLAVDDGTGGPGRPIEIPVEEADRLDKAWLDSLPAPLPPKLAEMLRRSGHEIRHQRQLMPFPLEDGRQLVVPVDQVEVHYVGNRAYQ